MKKFISWRRVSTHKQGKSGLGLEAQQSLINYFVEREGGTIVADYVEVYTGTHLEGCTELQKAKEVLKMAEMSYVAAIGAYRNIGKIFDDYKQKMIE